MSLTFFNQLSSQTIVATLFAITSTAIVSMTPAAAQVVYSVQKLEKIVPLQAGSVTIRGVQIPSNTSQWLQDDIQRLQGARWQFNNDGTFAFYLPNTRRDLYPITGYYRVQGNQLFFQGSRNSSTQVSRSDSFIDGVINLNERPSVMQFQWGTSSISASVVNKNSYGSNKTSAYNAVVTLKRIR